MIRPEQIESVVEDIVRGMLDCAHQPENSDAPPGSVVHAIRAGEITRDEMAAVVRERLEKAAKESA